MPQIEYLIGNNKITSSTFKSNGKNLEALGVEDIDGKLIHQRDSHGNIFGEYDFDNIEHEKLEYKYDEKNGITTLTFKTLSNYITEKFEKDDEKYEITVEKSQNWNSEYGEKGIMDIIRENDGLADLTGYTFYPLEIVPNIDNYYQQLIENHLNVMTN